MKRVSAQRLLGSILALQAFFNFSQAADIAVLPVGMTLTAEQFRRAITITNQGTETVTMQVEPVSWVQVDGNDEYTPTKALIINPPLFSIAPGKSQILRVGLRSWLATDKEVAYRLFLREVPVASTGMTNEELGHVQVLLELRLPVYVIPDQVTTTAQWHAQHENDGSLILTVTNSGNVHLVVAEVKLFEKNSGLDSKPITTRTVSTAVLAGQSRSWRFAPDPALLVKPVEFDVVTDRGLQSLTLDARPK